MEKPFTLQEAEQVCNYFQYLVGKELIDGDNESEITYIAISPFNIDPSFADYHHLNEGLADYKYTNPENEYDVIAIVMEYNSSDENLCRNIRSLVTEKGIAYNFPT